MQGATNGTPYKRQTSFDGSDWHWVDSEKEACEQPPLVNDVIRDKISEHGLAAVWPLLQLARNTVLSLVAETDTYLGTRLVAQANLSKLAKLDSKVDFLAARGAEEKAAP
jgi:hypothetical protein